MMPNKTLQHILAQINLDDIYIKQAFDYYHERFLANHRAQDFVNSSPLLCETMKQNPHIGLCDRTLGRHLPSARTMEGGAIREGITVPVVCLEPPAANYSEVILCFPVWMAKG